MTWNYEKGLHSIKLKYLKHTQKKLENVLVASCIILD